MPNAMPWPWGEGHPDEGPDGDVAVTVWHVGDGTRSTRPETTGCPNGTTPLPSSAARVAGTRPSPPPGAPPLVARVPCSANPGGLGTWLGSGCVSREGGEAGCPVDNPTAVAHANGTTLVAHRTWGGFGVLVAPHWSRP